MDDLLSVAQAAEVAGVSRQTIYNWMRQLRFPSYRHGSTWKVNRVEFQMYLDSRPAVRGVAPTSDSASEGAAGL
jgi:excisionase family DNA binding protein